MRQRFVQVLQTDDQDDAASDVLRRFWTRAKPLPARFEQRRAAQVIDLAAWARSRNSDVAKR
jgi:hypothetical protein